MLKKMVAALLSAVLLSQIMPCYAQTTEEKISIPVCVKELNEISVSKTLYRRGFALEEGKVFSLDKFALYNQDETYIPSFFEVTEKYHDGSIKWALCSFVTDLRPGEVKNLVIKNSGKKEIETPVVFEKTNNTAVLKNNFITATITDSGISISEKNTGIVEKINMFLELTGDEETLLEINDISVIKQNDLYCKIKTSGIFSGGHIGEIVLTLASDADNIDIEYRFTSKADISIFSMGLKMAPIRGSSVTYPECEWKSENIVGSDYFVVEKNGKYGYFYTRDNEKFRGATNDKDKTGFIFGENEIKFAPIINLKSYAWADGMTKTNHLYITFEKDGYKQSKTVKNPVSVTVDSKQFVKAGIIENDVDLAPIDVFMGTVYTDYTRRDGKIDAGALHYSVDPITGNVGTGTDRHPGEMEHNYGIGYMVSGDEKIYNSMMESAEFWADVYIYKGDLEEVYGANRYRISFREYQSRTSHPYYGDSSGLYMSYVLSGNEYLRDIYKIAIEHIYKNMYLSKNKGHNYPHMYMWNKGMPNRLTYVESRYMIQARPLYYAYGLFGDEKYREAALEIARWAASAQTDEGFWYQAMYDTGEPLIQGGQTEPAVKIYIWMFGLRGISFLSRYEDTEEIRAVLTKAADFVCKELEDYGPGLWHPTGNQELYARAEDGSRGKGRHEDIMGIELLYSAYRLTNNEKHLEAMLKCMKTWLSSMNPDGTCLLSLGDYGVSESYGAGGTTNYTLLQVMPEIYTLLQEKSELVKKLGYGYMLDVFSKNTVPHNEKATKINIREPEVMQCIYKNGDEQVLFACKQLAFKENEIHKDYYTVISEPGLWQGMENILTNTYEVTLHKYMDLFEEVTAVKRPIYLASMTGETVSVYIDKYTEDEIILRVNGKGQANLQIEDGLFKITDGENYSVKMSRGGLKEIKLIIQQDKNGKYTAKKGVLDIKVVINETLNLSDDTSSEAVFAVKNGYMKAENGSFHPDEKADLAEFNINVQKITGTNTTLNKSTLKDAVEYIIPFLVDKDVEAFKKFGIEKKTLTAIGNLSDSEAVKLGAELLEIPEFDVLGGDIELPKESVAGTKVEWVSSDESLVTNDGIFMYRGIPQENVTLTARVIKGEAVCERSYNFKLRGANDVAWTADSTVATENAHSLKNMSGKFDVAYTVKLNSAPTNALMAFSDSSKSAEAFSELPIIIRFSPDGFIDAYNDTGYASVEKLAYKKDEIYDVKLSADLEERTYSLSVIPKSEGKSYTIADKFKFRSTAPALSKVNVMYLPTATSGSALYTITKIDCAEFEKKPLTTMQMYNSDGLLFGKYAYEKVQLPLWREMKKIKWVSSDKDVVRDDGTIVLNNDKKDVFFYSLYDSGESALSALEMLKEIRLISKDADGDMFTRKNAAQILRALYYWY